MNWKSIKHGYPLDRCLVPGLREPAAYADAIKPLTHCSQLLKYM